MSSPATAPEPMRQRSARAAEVLAAAREILETEGSESLTMRRLGTKLGIQAPSIYKHFPNKAELELGLVEAAMAELGVVLHEAAGGGTRGAIARVLQAYRVYCVAHPELYRLATAGPLRRDAMTPELEEWAGEPFFLVTTDEDTAQALWAFAHGMVILEIDDRFPPDSKLDRTWKAGAEAFRPQARG